MREGLAKSFVLEYPKFQEPECDGKTTYPWVGIIVYNHAHYEYCHKNTSEHNMFAFREHYLIGRDVAG